MIRFVCSSPELPHGGMASQTKNHYIMVRHGESTANVEGLVVTDPAVGCVQYGLTDKGRYQAQQAAISVLLLMKSYDFKLKDVCIYYSDFKRTTETAKLLGQHLVENWGTTTNGQESVRLNVSELLRERRFGDLDKNKGDLSYEIIWKYDKLDADHTKYGVESVHHTFGRIKQFIEDMEQRNNGKVIIIVSHGDICQIMQTWFEGVHPRQHHDLPYIQNAEVRDLTAIAKKRLKSKL